MNSFKNFMGKASTKLISLSLVLTALIVLWVYIVTAPSVIKNTPLLWEPVYTHTYYAEHTSKTPGIVGSILGGLSGAGTAWYVGSIGVAAMGGAIAVPAVVLGGGLATLGSYVFGKIFYAFTPKRPARKIKGLLHYKGTIFKKAIFNFLSALAITFYLLGCYCLLKEYRKI